MNKFQVSGAQPGADGGVVVYAEEREENHRGSTSADSGEQPGSRPALLLLLREE